MGGKAISLIIHYFTLNPLIFPFVSSTGRKANFLLSAENFIGYGGILIGYIKRGFSVCVLVVLLTKDSPWLQENYSEISCAIPYSSKSPSYVLFVTHTAQREN